MSERRHGGFIESIAKKGGKVGDFLRGAAIAGALAGVGREAHAQDAGGSEYAAAQETSGLSESEIAAQEAVDTFYAALEDRLVRELAPENTSEEDLFVLFSDVLTCLYNPDKTPPQYLQEVPDAIQAEMNGPNQGVYAENGVVLYASPVFMGLVVRVFPRLSAKHLENFFHQEANKVREHQQSAVEWWRHVSHQNQDRVQHVTTVDPNRPSDVLSRGYGDFMSAMTGHNIAVETLVQFSEQGIEDFVRTVSSEYTDVRHVEGIGDTLDAFSVLVDRVMQNPNVGVETVFLLESVLQNIKNVGDSLGDQNVLGTEHAQKIERVERMLQDMREHAGG